MESGLLVLGIFAAAFVGFNIGGSSTGVAFGPAVGAKLLSKTAAATIMTVFVLLGGWTIGRNVIDTMGGQIVPSTMFTAEASIAILFFIGLGILIANVFGVPVPTSMTAVGSITGLGLATGTLDWAVMGRIISWWIVTPVIAFWVGAVIGRYLYTRLDRYFALEQSDGPLLTVKRRGMVPVPVRGPNTTRKELFSSLVVVLIGCYLGFAAGASNVANAVAPLAGSGSIDISFAILLGAGTIGLGAFTIARKTMDSVGNDLTEIPILAAVVVATTAATITTILSWMGIPISLVMATVMTIVGLGWGRASRAMTVTEMARGEKSVDFSVDSLTAESDPTVAAGQEDPENLRDTDDLFQPQATARFISLWIIGPSASTGLSYLFFTVLPII